MHECMNKTSAIVELADGGFDVIRDWAREERMQAEIGRAQVADLAARAAARRAYQLRIAGR